MPTEAEAEARSRVIEAYNGLYKLEEYEVAFRASGVPLPYSRLALPLKNFLSTLDKAWAAAFLCFNRCTATPTEFSEISEWLARRHQSLRSAVDIQTALPSDILLLGLVSLRSNLATLLQSRRPADFSF